MVDGIKAGVYYGQIVLQITVIEGKMVEMEKIAAAMALAAGPVNVKVAVNLSLAVATHEVARVTCRSIKGGQTRSVSWSWMLPARRSVPANSSLAEVACARTHDVCSRT